MYKYVLDWSTFHSYFQVKLYSRLEIAINYSPILSYKYVYIYHRDVTYFFKSSYSNFTIPGNSSSKLGASGFQPNNLAALLAFPREFIPQLIA